MINKEFYATTNELVARATKGQITNIVNYSSFIDAGKKLADMDISEWGNAFMSELMNKVKLTINMFRTYESSLADMTKQTVNGGAIEMIMHTFYSARKAMFSGLTDGETVDPFIVALPTIQARYYVNTNDYNFTITRSDSDLIGAFESPAAMDAFYQTVFGDVLNSIALHKENNRLAVLCDIARESIAHGIEIASTDTPATCYNVLKIYNSVKGTTLTVAECLDNADFVIWVSAFIRLIKIRITKPNVAYNIADEMTFTPMRAQALKLNAKFETAMRTALVGAYNPNYAVLEDYESIPYWQNSKTPLIFTTSNSNTTTTSPAMLAILYDKDYACGEYPDFESAESIRNPRGRYTNTFWNIRTRYVRNGAANVVTFVIA